ncbi:hypothetical protein CLV30_11026 [Haloactinopolyspora alba]|uniref:Uncharacterized protein n=1 Tax=Haloactinopolyspora alba TaxID=648780 RepID=A0A2P8DYS8_9ACTN|nr:hypothetical protein [Haloactinopolyspora alba]PSL02373.1 hypothetical protein CLV30_11026 [Haloactinopolyspora alba]
MSPSPRRTRTISRGIHLTAALLLGTYVYAPDHVTDGMRMPMMVLVVPAATLTGLFMWKQAAVRAWFARIGSGRGGPRESDRMRSGS